MLSSKESKDNLLQAYVGHSDLAQKLEKEFWYQDFKRMSKLTKKIKDLSPQVRNLLIALGFDQHDSVNKPRRIPDFLIELYNEDDKNDYEIQLNGALFPLNILVILYMRNLYYKSKPGKKEEFKHEPEVDDLLKDNKAILSAMKTLVDAGARFEANVIFEPDRIYKNYLTLGLPISIMPNPKAVHRYKPLEIALCLGNMDSELGYDLLDIFLQFSFGFEYESFNRLYKPDSNRPLSSYMNSIARPFYLDIKDDPWTLIHKLKIKDVKAIYDMKGDLPLQVVLQSMVNILQDEEVDSNAAEKKESMSVLVSLLREHSHLNLMVQSQETKVSLFVHMTAVGCLYPEMKSFLEDCFSINMVSLLHGHLGEGDYIDLKTDFPRYESKATPMVINYTQKIIGHAPIDIQKKSVLVERLKSVYELLTAEYVKNPAFMIKKNRLLVHTFMSIKSINSVKEHCILTARDFYIPLQLIEAIKSATPEQVLLVQQQLTSSVCLAEKKTHEALITACQQNKRVFIRLLVSQIDYDIFQSLPKLLAVKYDDKDVQKNNLCDNIRAFLFAFWQHRKIQEVFPTEKDLSRYRTFVGKLIQEQIKNKDLMFLLFQHLRADVRIPLECTDEEIKNLSTLNMRDRKFIPIINRAVLPEVYTNAKVFKNHIIELLHLKKNEVKSDEEKVLPEKIDFSVLSNHLGKEDILKLYDLFLEYAENRSNKMEQHAIAVWQVINKKIAEHPELPSIKKLKLEELIKNKFNQLVKEMLATGWDADYVADRAAFYGNMEALQLAVKHGAKLKEQDHRQYVPAIAYAIKNQDLQMVCYLAEAVEVSLSDVIIGMSALELAAYLDCQDIYNLLLKYSAKMSGEKIKEAAKILQFEGCINLRGKISAEIAEARKLIDSHTIKYLINIGTDCMLWEHRALAAIYFETAAYYSKQERVSCYLQAASLYNSVKAMSLDAKICVENLKLVQSGKNPITKFDGMQNTVRKGLKVNMDMKFNRILRKFWNNPVYSQVKKSNIEVKPDVEVKELQVLKEIKAIIKVALHDGESKTLENIYSIDSEQFKQSEHYWEGCLFQELGKRIALKMMNEIKKHLKKNLLPADEIAKIIKERSEYYKNQRQKEELIVSDLKLPDIKEAPELKINQVQEEEKLEPKKIDKLFVAWVHKVNKNNKHFDCVEKENGQVELSWKKTKIKQEERLKLLENFKEALKKKNIQFEINESKIILSVDYKNIEADRVVEIIASIDLPLPVQNATEPVVPQSETVAENKQEVKPVEKNDAKTVERRSKKEPSKQTNITISFVKNIGSLTAFCEPKKVDLKASPAKEDKKSLDEQALAREVKSTRVFKRATLIKNAFSYIAKMISMQDKILDDFTFTDSKESAEWRAVRHFATLYYLIRTFVLLKAATLETKAEIEVDMTDMRNVIVHGSRFLIQEESAVKDIVNELQGKKLPKELIEFIPKGKRRQKLARCFAQDQEGHRLIDESYAYQALRKIFISQETTEIPYASHKIKELLNYANVLMGVIKNASKKAMPESWFRYACENASSLAERYSPIFEAVAVLFGACGELAEHAQELKAHRNFLSLCKKIRADLGHREKQDINYLDILQVYEKGQRIDSRCDLSASCFAQPEPVVTKKKTAQGLAEAKQNSLKLFVADKHSQEALSLAENKKSLGNS